MRKPDQTLWSYYCRLRRTFIKNANEWPRDNIAFAVFMLVAPAVFGLLYFGAAPDWKALWGTLLMYAFVTLVYALYHAVRAPWLLDKEPKQETLTDRVTVLAHDLIHFVEDAGPEPEPPRDNGKSLEENIRAIMRVVGPHQDKVHYGYEEKFRTRTEIILNALAGEGLKDLELNSLASCGLHSPDKIKSVVQKLLSMRNELEVRELRAATAKLVNN